MKGGGKSRLVVSTPRQREKKREREGLKRIFLARPNKHKQESVREDVDVEVEVEVGEQEIYN